MGRYGACVHKGVFAYSHTRPSTHVQRVKCVHTCANSYMDSHESPARSAQAAQMKAAQNEATNLSTERDRMDTQVEQNNWRHACICARGRRYLYSHWTRAMRKS